MDHFRAAKKGKKEQNRQAGLAAGPGRWGGRGTTRVGRPGSRPRPAARPGDGRQCGAPGWAGLGAGPGRWRGRRPTRVVRPVTRIRTAGRPGRLPNGPAWEPAQAGGEAGCPPFSFSFLIILSNTFRYRKRNIFHVRTPFSVILDSLESSQRAQQEYTEKHHCSIRYGQTK